MNKYIFIALIALSFSPTTYSYAEESTEIKPPVASEETAKAKYEFTDTDLQLLKNSKITEAQYPMVGVLMKESGKTAEEIIKMRTEQKMGWGKVAKTLGLPPNILGQAASGMHRQEKQDREARKEERKQQRDARKQAHKEERSQREKKSQ